MLNKNSIVVKYIYSACIVTESPDVKILHDPWFTQGVYDGAWYHFPVISNPLELIGDCDFIYISHVHPDHYDPIFLEKYFDKFGSKKILIANHSTNHLKNKIKIDGFECEVLEKPFHVGSSTVEIYPYNTSSESDIDSSLSLTYFDGNRKHVILNTNDCIFEKSFLEKIKQNLGEIDILLTTYTGAGPYPQTYYDVNDSELTKKAEIKKNSFIERYKETITIINAKRNIPFAGKYLLGGGLSHLNKYRGVIDQLDIKVYDPFAIILADAGGSIDTKNLDATNIRTEYYSEGQIDNRILEISKNKFDYELLFSETHQNMLPVKRLLYKAYVNALKKSEVDYDYYMVIKIDNHYAILNLNNNLKPNINYFDNVEDLPSPRSVIYLDKRYLFGLLTNVFHWNNAEIGSHIRCRRFPDIFDRRVQRFLNFLTL
jgi:UDP-MurNAc hydroxylase